jgi:putative ABC transport system permease protein
MKTLDLIGTAVGITFRAKTRTLLTILAIFVGAFTLTLTNGVGTGINAYIDSTVSSLGASDVMTVTKKADTTTTSSSSSSTPQKYSPTNVDQRGPGGGTVSVMTQDDIDKLAKVDGVTKAEAVKSVSLDYIQYDGGTKYVASAGSFVSGQTVQLAKGSQPDASTGEYQLALPSSYVKPLGFSSDADAIGSTVSIALTDGTATQKIIKATVVGISEASFSLGGSADAITPNDALSSELYKVQQVGVPSAKQGQYTQARVWVASDATDSQITAVQNSLDKAGYDSSTIQQQLGTFTTVINAIVLVLNAFAVIALLAASFGIVNTLLMSVQERTREIGLMKAMGMGSGRVFGLFSFEATFIGFLGSAIGVGIAMLAGTAVSGALAGSLLSDLPGLQLIAFDPASVAVIIGAVMLIAFLAGTLPAARAAKADPVESLRYE